MPNKSEINRELVKAFNSILRFSDDVFTNCTVDGTFSSKEDHIVILFDNNMTLDQRIKYLKSMKEKVIERFCPDQSILDDNFYTKFFPFNFDQGKLAEDNKFLVPIRKEVVSNLKFLLANEIARFATSTIVERKKEDKKLELGCEDLPDDIEEEIENHVDYNIIDEVFDKGSYLYGAECVDRNLQRSFVDLLSSRITGYENGPKKTKDFLEEKGNYVYLKKSIFDNPKLIKDIVKHIVSLTCRCFDIPNTEDKIHKIMKFTVVDLFRKANIQVDFMVRNSYLGGNEDSVLIPIVSGSNGNRYLTREEVNHVNNMFGMDVLNNVEAYTSQKSLLNSNSKGLYGIDFANPDISYCVMNKVIESSVINKDYKLSIDPARVQAMKPQTLAPPKKVEIAGPSADTSADTSADSDFCNSPKNSVIGKSHTGNSSKFLRPDYYGGDKGGDDASAKDSGLGHSSARSSFNKPKTNFEQCSAKKSTSVGKDTSCCIS
ncbi:MAG: hypothetical protein AB3P07_02220 [Wolbachia pipientis]